MIILDIQPNTHEWEEFRRTKIGASDCPIVLGISPHKTPLKLWEEKKLGKKGRVTSAMDYGSEKEKNARDTYSILKGKSFKPMVAQADEYDWMVATLDGISEDGKEIIEIKCPQENTLREAMSGNYPEYWYWQCQHQLYVTGQLYVTIVVYNELCSELPQLYEIVVNRNDDCVSQLLEAEKEFHKSMIEFKPPEPTAKDYVERSDDKWQSFSARYIEAKQRIEEWTDILKELKKEGIELAGGNSCKGYGVMATLSFPQGTVDYSSIPELKGVDLNLYRKPTREQWTFRVS